MFDCNFLELKENIYFFNSKSSYVQLMEQFQKYFSEIKSNGSPPEGVRNI